MNKEQITIKTESAIDNSYIKEDMLLVLIRWYLRDG